MYAAEAVAERLAASSVQEEAPEGGGDSEEQRRHQSRGGKALPKDTTKQKDREELKRRVPQSWPRRAMSSYLFILEGSGHN